MKYSFKNDYAEGAHPQILQALAETNMLQSDGYGLDSFSEHAKSILYKHINFPQAQVHFLVGGTQTNLIALSSFLRPHEAVIAVSSGHILVHETGAIEATGHKIISTKGKEGKIYIPELEALLKEHSDEHMVKPRLVYISNASEIGTIYSKEELETLYRFCKDQNLLLYMDGARLGAALTAHGNNLSLSDIAASVDAFYIGGTKNGALFGEALVISNPSLQKDFRFLIKQKGGLLAKGRLLAIQFLTLFQDNLFFDLAKHGNTMAGKIQKELKDLGFSFFIESPTNQIFPIFPKTLIKELEKDYGFYVWEDVSASEAAIRLVTSWATKEDAVESFIKAVEKSSTYNLKK